MSEIAPPEAGHTLVINEQILFIPSGGQWLDDKNQQAVGKTFKDFLDNNPSNQVWILKTTVDTQSSLAKYNDKLLDFASFGNDLTDDKRLSCKTYLWHERKELEGILAKSTQPTTFITAIDEMVGFIQSSLQCNKLVAAHDIGIYHAKLKRL